MTGTAPIRAGGGGAGTKDEPAAEQLHQRPSGSGLVHMVQAAFWFAVMALLVKLAGRTLPAMQIVFARGCVTLLISVLLLWRARLRPVGTAHGLLLLRGFVGSLALMCFYMAVVGLPLAEATVVHQTAPIFTAVLAAVVLRERLQLRVVLAMLVALAGVVVIARPAALFATGAAPLPWQYVALALAGAVLSAIAYVTLRRLGRSEHPLVVVFYFPLVTVPLSAPFAFASWVPPTPTEWLMLIGIGTVTQIAQISLTKGLAREAAARATAVGYLQVAFATLFGALVLGAVPDRLSWLGMSMIVASLFVATRR